MTVWAIWLCTSCGDGCNVERGHAPTCDTCKGTTLRSLGEVHDYPDCPAGGPPDCPGCPGCRGRPRWPSSGPLGPAP